jgi:diacylglycerol kinase family enzyme
MTRRKAVLITNPKARGYASKRSVAIESFRQRLLASGIDFELITTNGPNQAGELAKSAVANGATDIVAYGGDGTVNEALQGLAGSNARLAVWAGGTANVLARELAMPVKPQAVAEVIANGKTLTTRPGRIVKDESGEDRYFILMAGIGLDASVVNAVRPEMKKRFGKLAFWYAGLGHLAWWEPSSFQIQVGERTYTSTFTAIGKSPRYGGNLAITPGARLDIDEFEVCIVDSNSRLRYLRLLGSAVAGKIAQDVADVAIVRATTVRAIGNQAVQADGELVGTLPMTFKMADWTLDLIVP